MKINCRQTEWGVEFSVKASPGSRKTEIRGVVEGALKISVTAVAEKGKANAAVIKLLSKELRISKQRFELKSGATSKLKKLIVRDVSLNTFEQNLNRLAKQAKG